MTEKTQRPRYSPGVRERAARMEIEHGVSTPRNRRQSCRLRTRSGAQRLLYKPHFLLPHQFVRAENVLRIPVVLPQLLKQRIRHPERLHQLGHAISLEVNSRRSPLSTNILTVLAD